jgi:hypothetical protein
MKCLHPLAQTLGSWFRVPLETWVSLCCSVVVSGLAMGWYSVQGDLSTVYRIKKLISGQGPRKGSRVIDRDSERERCYLSSSFWTLSQWPWPLIRSIFFSFWWWCHLRLLWGSSTPLSSGHQPERSRFLSRWGHSHYGTGVDSDSNGNEYQESSWV